LELSKAPPATFPYRDISKATSGKLAGQLWYLSEDLILFTLFDSDVDVTTKCDIESVNGERWQVT